MTSLLFIAAACWLATAAAFIHIDNQFDNRSN